MKKLLFLFIVCLLGGCRAEKGNMVVITGKGEPGKIITLQQNGMGASKFVLLDTLDESGNFRFEYLLEEPGLYKLVAEKMFVPLLVKPGEKMEVELTGGKVVFRGDAAERNQFVQEFTKQEALYAQKFPKNYGDALGFRNAADQQYQAVLHFLEESDMKDEEVKGILEADVTMRYYSSLVKYPFFHQLLSGNAEEMPEGFYSFFDELDLSSPYFACLGDISPFLQELFLAMEENSYLSGEKDDYLVKRAEWIQNPKLREAYLLYVIGQVEMFGYNQHLGKQLEKVKPFIVTPEGQTELKKLSEKYAQSAKENEKFNAGQPAIDFSGTDAENKEHRLSDYRGKVVVVDVWNTGCKPCIAEIPFLRKLEERFAGKDVVFVSYAVEANPEAWKQFLKTHEMGENQWINTEAFKSPFAQAYQVRFIPRFMVFSKNGQIVDVYAPRPSNPRLAQLIEEELNK